MPGRLLRARLGPPAGQRLLLLDGAANDGQADVVQQEHAALPSQVSSHDLIIIVCGRIGSNMM